MELVDFGVAPYGEVYDFQKKMVEEVSKGMREELLIACAHFPIVTLGRQTKEEDLISYKKEFFSIERGGQATYHGPGQIVIYPIIDLKKREHDLGHHLRSLEEAMIRALKKIGLEAHGAKGEKYPTGVWVEGKKIASIGIAVRRWITYHGLALNLHYDKEAFQDIRPCGFSSSVMSSVEEITGVKFERSFFQEILIEELKELLKVKNQKRP